jgi:hypothetical protein
MTDTKNCTCKCYDCVLIKSYEQGKDCHCSDSIAGDTEESWEKKLEDILMNIDDENVFHDLNFIIADLIKAERDTAYREEAKKTIIRFEILKGRMQACEEDHPDTHKVSLIEIDGWIDELKEKHR